MTRKKQISVKLLEKILEGLPDPMLIGVNLTKPDTTSVRAQAERLTDVQGEDLMLCTGAYDCEFILHN